MQQTRVKMTKVRIINIIENSGESQFYTISKFKPVHLTKKLPLPTTDNDFEIIDYIQ